MSRFLDFTGQKYIQFDIETKDPNLKKQGSGVYRKDGYILGVALGGEPGSPSEYYALGHPETTRQEEQKNLAYLREVLGSNIPKLGTNIKYDIDWLTNGYGVKVNGELNDVQVAEPLLDEYRRTYSLDSLSKDYLGKAKKNELPYQWCMEHDIKLKNPGDAVQHLWKMPSDIVRPYALGDVDLPGRIFALQKGLLEAQGLWELYQMECKIIPVLLRMRKQGARLDKNRMAMTGMGLADAVLTGEKDLFKKVGRKVNIKSSKDVQWMMDKYGLEYPYKEPTAIMKEKGITKGNPCLDKNVLGGTKHWMTEQVLELRHMKTLNSMFIQPYMHSLVGDRLHGDFNQLKSDDSGTVSGRFSGKNPNLQQVSGKEEDEEVTMNPLLKGKIIRDLYIPEEGSEWLKHDWSQIEYRIIAHYAIGEKAEEIRGRYRANPDTDYHKEMGEMTGLKDRKVIKTLNFGAAYGMGPKTMAIEYGWTREYANEVYNMYHSKVPFVRTTSNRVGSKAKSAGYIKTLLGRRARLLHKDKAYVMFNRLIQGSAADMMKAAMVEAEEKGLFDVLPLHLTVHDELGNSMKRTPEGLEAARELKHTMENTLKLKVPVIADAEIGPTWGTLTDFTA